MTSTELAIDRMRNATILVIRLRGTATEAIKNIVLAGIGKLVIYDSEEVKEEDLGAGFFFRDEDVGKKVLQVSTLADFLWLFIGFFLIESRCRKGSNRGTESTCYSASPETSNASRAGVFRSPHYER